VCVYVCDVSDGINPMHLMKSGYNISLGLAFFGFVFATKWLLSSEKAPDAWKHYLGCGVMGMITSYVFILSTQYNTDYAYWPVQSIAQASTTGHGTNIIAGVLCCLHLLFGVSLLLLFSHAALRSGC
jgi:Na+/H+-translocating membrane pyrophosphatase